MAEEAPVGATTESPAASPKKKGLLGLISSVGPGFVYALTVLGTGDVVSNSTAGAGYRYALLWALALTLVFRYVWVNTSAKYVLVTGESLLAGYGRLGRWVPLVLLASLFPIRHFTNQFLMLIMGSSAHLLLPLPTEWSSQIWTVAFTLLGFGMAFWGGYPIIESFCKLLVGIMGASLLVAALLSDPDPAGIARGILVPSMPQAQGLYSALLIVMALVGTEAGSTANMTYAYFISQRGWTNASFLRTQRIDLAVGVLCLFFMGALLQIAAAGTIHPLGIQVEHPEDLARIFSETQGVIGLVAFSLGMWGAAFSSFIGFNTGYALIATDIFRGFIPGLKKDTASQKNYDPKKDPVYRFLIFLWSIPPLYIIFTQTRAIWLVLMVMAFIVLLIPMMAVGLLKITNDKDLMGDYRNGWITNGVLVVLTVIALYITYRNGVELWGNLMGGIRPGG